MLDDAVSLHGDEGCGARKRILDQVARSLADLVRLLLRAHAQSHVGGLFPKHAPFAGYPHAELRGVRAALAVADGGRNAVKARMAGRESAALRLFPRRAAASAIDQPLRSVTRQVGIARALDAGR